MTGLPTRGSQPDFQFSFLSTFWFQGEEGMGWTVAYSPCLKFHSALYTRQDTQVLGCWAAMRFFFFFFADKKFFFFKADKFFNFLISPVQGGEILPTSRR